MVDKKYTYYIDDAPKKLYFESYAEAWGYVMKHDASGTPGGIFHIYPVDNSGYTSKSNGRKSFGKGNKDWEKTNPD
jgi:hypothetical protein